VPVLLIAFDDAAAGGALDPLPPVHRARLPTLRFCALPGLPDLALPHATGGRLRDLRSAGASPSGYRPDVDGLRAIAVLAVLAFHAFPELLPGGFVGVDVFFVLSGFLITGILLPDLAREEFSLRKFYARRVRRIFPALVVVLAACGIFGWFALFPDEFDQLGKHIAAGAAFVSNLALWRET